MSSEFEAESKRSFAQLIDAIRRDRDRIRIQLNLAHKELRDDWQELESKWEELESDLGRAGHEAAHLAHDVAEELAQAYRALKSRLN